MEDDLTKLKRTFDEMGIGYEIVTEFSNRTILRCSEGREKIEGYSMFFTDFEFDEAGNFIVMGAWE